MKNQASKDMVALPRIGAQISTAGGLLDVPQRAAAIGAEVVQIFNSNARMWRTQTRTPDEIEALREGLRVRELPLFLHSIYLINLASEDAQLRRRSIDALADALALARATDAAGLVTHIGSRRLQGFSEAANHIIDCVLTAYASHQERAEALYPQQLGGRTVAETGPALLLETSSGSGTTVGGSFDELESLLEALPDQCGVCLDTAHLFAAGYPIHTEDGLEETVAELRSRGLLARVALVHLNDSKSEFASNRDRHENLGDGLIGYAALARFVGHPAFRRVPFAMEVPGLEGKGPDMENIRRARSMRPEAPSPPVGPARLA